MFQKMLNAIEKLIGGGARPPNTTTSEQDSTKSAVTEQPRVPRQIMVFRGAVIIVIIGAMIMLLANFLEVDEMLVNSTSSQEFSDISAQLTSASQPPNSPFSTIETALEQRTKDILEKMIGVGKVSVLITVDSTEEQIIEQNKSESRSVTQETDKNGGIREVTTTTNDGQVVFMETSGEQEPVITKVINPRIRGVLIVAEGAEDATVRKLIIQAVEKGLNVHQTKISVVPSKI